MPRGPHARRAWRADGDVRRAPASAASVERDTLLHSAELAPASLASPGTPLRGPRLSPFAAPGRAGPGLSRLARTPPRDPRLSRPLWLTPRHRHAVCGRAQLHTVRRRVSTGTASTCILSGFPSLGLFFLADKRLERAEPADKAFSLSQHLSTLTAKTTLTHSHEIKSQPRRSEAPPFVIYMGILCWRRLSAGKLLETPFSLFPT